MSYIYSKINRLEKPHNYMYTPYYGADLLESYESSRVQVINRFIDSRNLSFNEDSALLHELLPVFLEPFSSNLNVYEKNFGLLLQKIRIKVTDKNINKTDNVKGKKVNLNDIKITESVSTSKLLYSLSRIFLVDVHNLNAKSWLDRLVQRFEVTKKIYESYLPGFRQGKGCNELIRLYWLLALTLCIFYLRSKEIKYLSTLLKLNDLLCSLSESDLKDNIPQHGLVLVLITELLSIKLLSNRKGISFASY